MFPLKKCALTTMGLFATAGMLALVFAGHRDTGDSLKANINSYFDQVVENLKGRLLDAKYDPMSLSEQTLDVSVKSSLGLFNYTWTAGLRNGTLKNLTHMKREGNATLNYNQTKITIEAKIEFDVLELTYDYVAQLMKLGPHGQLKANVTDLDVDVVMEVDLLTMKIKLKSLNLRDASKLKFNTTGLFLLNYPIDIITNLVTNLFKTQILQLVEDRVRVEAAKAVESVDVSAILG